MNPTQEQIDEFITELNEYKAGGILPLWPYKTQPPSEVIAAMHRAVSKAQRHLAIQGAMLFSALVIFIILLFFL
jgi:hypothetical protein